MVTELRREISYSQASQKCGYALRFYRQRAPKGPRSIGLVVGDAVHAGIQYHLAFADVRERVDDDGVIHHVDPVDVACLNAQQELDFQIERDYVRWDEPHRLTRAGQVYTSDRGRIPSYEFARAVVAHEVRAWCARFPALRSEAVERPVRLDIGQGWTLTGRLDVEAEGGVIDIKTSTDAWDVTGREFERLEQAQLYQYARLLEDGAPPAFFVFHVIPHSGLRFEMLADDNGQPAEVAPVDYDPEAIQVIEVAYDEAAVERAIEHRVAPQVRTIEADAYVPNTSGWWHDPKWCSYWEICPLGAAARNTR